ncbi:hypothetical protein [Pseudonocardia abyssalis]|uniref:DNA primase/polymerase bifunctional N-terminal domain-containing protein n=1 Tax=Pseudonocardia abyssalis TaxID=2792008 RepID=A0ABS6UYI7_9PSEU|nr:hypothetical protein [Pseudonocardia abyssalis]MBW0115209.1 hypothetical protein [Pseudonocardia abyssalis]MBW0136784.1 hypothetical protein [Pseudonocardia abyssalis]
MPGWDSYRTVHGAELRAAAREFTVHGWPVIEESVTALRLVTGTALDVLEVPAAVGRGICAQLRAVDIVVPVAGTPTGSWWYPMAPGAVAPADLLAADGVVLHSTGGSVIAPPSQVPDGWVHWRVAPALTGYLLPSAELIIPAATESVRWRADHDRHPGAQRPAAAAVAGMRS